MLKINQKLLEDGILALGLDKVEHKVRQLIAYIQLLHKWNKVYSLTAIKAADDIVKYHLLDGLTLMPYVDGVQSILDVGSGMGVPVVIIAIWYPNTMVVALDSNNKKTAFLQQVAIELGLSNLAVVKSRVEEYRAVDGFDIITSRAFADVEVLVQLAGHLLRHKGCFLAMKGINVVKELASSSLSMNAYQTDALRVRVPIIDLERVLLKITHKVE